MAHYPKIFDFTGGGSVTDITFNKFFNSMGQFGGSPRLDEGWYRIVDHRTTGYVLDRQYTLMAGGTEHKTYGCFDAIDSLSGSYADIYQISSDNNVESEPILVWVTIDKRSGFNRHQHRVYSEIHPQDEIHWTWDWGIDFKLIHEGLLSEWGFIYEYPYDIFLRELNFLTDSTLFSPDYQGYNRPLQSIEYNDFYTIVIQANERYDWNYWRGYTYYRKDHEKNIEGSYDWRNVFLCRYSSMDWYKGWESDVEYQQGDVLFGSDNWLYVSLVPKNRGFNPILYDSMNAPLANDPVSGNPSFIGAITGMEPTSPYAPLSSRRAWLRLWPRSYKWYSPWANGGNMLGKIYFYGDAQVDPTDRIAQPYFFELLCDYQPYYCKTFSGDEDNFSDKLTSSNLTYISNVNLGTKSYPPAGPDFRHRAPKGPNPPTGIRGPLLAGYPWNSSFDSDPGKNTFYTPTTIHPISNYDMMSYVNDNRIVTFPLNTDPSDNIPEGNDKGGIIDGLKFGTNSMGNTFYVIPSDFSTRIKFWSDMESQYTGLLDISRKNYNYSSGWMIPDDKQQFGGMNLDSGDATNISLGDFTNVSQLTNVASPFSSFNEIDMVENSRFGNNDFGDNFIGNVTFNALVHTSDDGRYPYNYPRVDDFKLTENIDGVFTGNKFKNNNRYNLFLHGTRNCTINTSEASIIETASELDVKSSMYDFLRNVYSLNMDDSRYNSIWSAININSSGSIMHNYLDSIYSSTMDDGFWYNDISMFWPDPYLVTPLPWPNGITEAPIRKDLYQDGYYYPSGFNKFGPGFAGNSIRGWAVSNTFRSNYYDNYKTNKDYAWETCPTYLVNNMFGESIHGSYIWKSTSTEFEPRSFHDIQIDPANSFLLWLDFNKKVRLPGGFSSFSGTWELSDQPILSFGDNYGVEQFQLWQDSSSIVPFVAGWGPTPYPGF